MKSILIFFTILVNNLFKYLKKVNFSVGLFLFLAILFSCKNEDNVSTAGSSTLNEDQLETIARVNQLNIDSTKQLNKVLNEWAEGEIYLQELKEVAPQEYEEIILRSRQYAAQLAEFKIKDNYFKNVLDTAVTESQITNYYNENKNQFKLQDYIVKGLLLKIPKTVDFQKEKIQEKFLLKKDKDLEDIESFAKLYAVDYYFSDSNWVFFEQFAQNVPLEKYNVDNLVLQRTKTYFSDDDFTYFINIREYNLKDEIPPIQFLKGQITSIILTQRLQELKKKNSKKIIEELKEKYEINLNN